MRGGLSQKIWTKHLRLYSSVYILGVDCRMFDTGNLVGFFAQIELALDGKNIICVYIIVLPWR